MATVSLPNIFAPNTPALASEVNANFDAIIAQVNGNIQAVNLANSAVTENKIADGAVGTVKLANLAVESGKIADGAVGTTKLANAAVTPEKLSATYLESGPAILLDNTDDLNDIMASGFFAWLNTSLPANAPISAFTQMVSIVRSSSSRVQIAITSSGFQRMFVRGFTSGAWQSWWGILHENTPTISLSGDITFTGTVILPVV
jgi:hypothetical protein